MKGDSRHKLSLQVADMGLFVLISDTEIGGIWNDKMLES
jgi:hypothetical protein